MLQIDTYKNHKLLTVGLVVICYILSCLYIVLLFSVESGYLHPSVCVHRLYDRPNTVCGRRDCQLHGEQGMTG